MAPQGAAPEIYNGARCKTYSWSQSHSDLEVRIELEDQISYENLKVGVTSDHIRVDWMKSLNTVNVEEKTIVEGDFEDSVDQESVYWVLNTERRPCLIIYMDKTIGKWWDKLLKNEEASEKGPVDRIIDMDDLEDGSRMAIDKLINEQKSKLFLHDVDDFSFV